MLELGSWSWCSPSWRWRLLFTTRLERPREMTRPSTVSCCIARVAVATVVYHSAARGPGAWELLLVAVGAGLNLGRRCRDKWSYRGIACLSVALPASVPARRIA